MKKESNGDVDPKSIECRFDNVTVRSSEAGALSRDLELGDRFTSLNVTEAQPENLFEKLPVDLFVCLTNYFDRKSRRRLLTTCRKYYKLRDRIIPPLLVKIFDEQNLQALDHTASPCVEENHAEDSSSELERRTRSQPTSHGNPLSASKDLISLELSPSPSVLPLSARLLSAPPSRPQNQFIQTLTSERVTETDQPVSLTVSPSLLPPAFTSAPSTLPFVLPSTNATETSKKIQEVSPRRVFRSITEAIEAAQPFDQILVRSGTYDESLLITKPIELRAIDGPVIVRSTKSTALRMSSTHGRVSGFTFRQYAKFPCVKISGPNSIEISNCDISCVEHRCIEICGDDCNPIIINNHIHDAKESGLWIHTNAKGKIFSNWIFGNAYSSIQIALGADPDISRNVITHSAQNGILIFQNAKGKISHNDIYGHKLAGIEIKQNANPTISHNRIHHCQQCGVINHSFGSGVITYNEIYSHTLSGVAIRQGSNPSLYGNKIYLSGENGILVYQEGQGDIHDNEIFLNSLSGIEVRLSGAPTIHNNQVYKNHSNGIHVWKSGKGIIKRNQIRHNMKSGVLIEEKGCPNLTKNHIFGCGMYGISLKNEGKTLIEDNYLYENKLGDIFREVVKDDDRSMLNTV